MFNEEYYRQQVQQLKQKYPKIGRRVYKTRKKTWKQVFEEMLDTIKKTRKTRIKNQPITIVKDKY
jgi:L-lactate utilization protein LutC